MTKREAKVANETWRAALAAGLVVKIVEFPGNLTSYPTVEARDAAMASARAAELTPEIVQV